MWRKNFWCLVLIILFLNCFLAGAEEDSAIELQYDREIRNGEEVSVKVNTENIINGNYQVKIYLVNEEEKIISDIYDNQKEKWISGNYYVKLNSDKQAEIRIKEKYSDFKGESLIYGKIRKENKTEVIAEFSGNIKILKIANQTIEETNMEITGEVIKEELTIPEESNIVELNSKDIKSEKINEYKSSNEYVREYGIIVFILFCSLMLMVLLKKFNNREY
ncbi:hypothetical protein HYW76_03215 [Candidatus Pacearchaeota archaeon]|nr:hypothetical protein [Candidatus Pacearchaeota archaeon]